MVFVCVYESGILYLFVILSTGFENNLVLRALLARKLAQKQARKEPKRNFVQNIKLVCVESERKKKRSKII